MEVNFFILDIDYVEENGKSVVRMFGRTEDGRSIIVKDREFSPYFLVLPKKASKALSNRIMEIEIEGNKPTKIEEISKTFLRKKQKLLKVYVDYSQDVPKFRDVVKGWKEVKEEYEYSINFARRYLIDKGLYPVSWINVSGQELDNKGADIVIEAKKLELRETIETLPYSIMAFDIEILEDQGKEKLAMISIKDNAGFSRVFALGNRARGIETFSSERELLEAFMDTVKKKDPDFLITYSGDRYDFTKLQEKANENKIELTLSRNGRRVEFKRRGRISSAYVPGRIHIDLYDFVETVLSTNLSTEILTLDKVALELVGKGKSMTWKEVESCWKKGNIKKVAKYCLRDSALTLELAEMLLLQILEISRVVGQMPFDTSRMSYSQLVEWVLIRKAFEMGEIIPNIPKYDEIQRRRRAPPYEGGYVFPPKEGIHENIALFDFSSLYPSITITHNISPDSLYCKDCRKKERHQVPGERSYYCSKRKGFVTAVIEDLLNRRKEIKKELKSAKGQHHRALNNRQYALKIIANASYGYYGYAGSRWYSRVAAISITSFGRYYIKKVIEKAIADGFNVIYGDTDSIFISVKDRAQAVDYLNKINNSLPGIMEMEFKDIYKAGIFVKTKEGARGAKKRYALLDGGGKITIRGFERVRRDWSDIAKKMQESILSAILKDRSPKKAIKIVQKTIDSVRDGKVEFNDLVIYTQLTKPLSEYEQIGPHVAAAKKSVEKGRVIRVGHTIEYIVTKGTGSISDRSVPVEDAKNYDPDYYINNQIMPAALRVLASIGITEKEILEGKKIEQHTLSGYFK